MDETISLNKFISDTGYCSRRKADNLITSGRVLLNDHIATLGNRYKPGDTVEVDGSLITAAKKEKRVYLALNKPVGITSTTELHVKGNIISFIGYPKRIFPIGRLDKDSEGLIFLTNDGDIINKILRAANNHEKEYIVRVNKPIDGAFVKQMSQGVPILDTRTLPCKVQMIGRQTFKIVLTQGLNRQIRRMCEYLGYAVVGLQRIRIMNIRLDKLPVGKWRYLSEAEMTLLMDGVAASATNDWPANNKPAYNQKKKGSDRRDKPSSTKDKPTYGKYKPARDKGSQGHSAPKAGKTKPGAASANARKEKGRSRQEKFPTSSTDRKKGTAKNSRRRNRP